VIAAATGASCIRYHQLANTVANRMITVSFTLLLGLRLLFCSSWKIIWSLQFYLSKKFRRFVLVSVSSSNRRKAAGTLTASIETKKILFATIEKITTFGTMKTLTVNIPDNLDLTNRELVMLLASKLYEQGKLSLGQAAELAGLTKRTFAELLNQYNVSIFNFPSSDLSSDVKNA
jgi:predicted HTH domain antitoxin